MNQDGKNEAGNKIIVVRNFGTAKLLELYSEYVAKQICKDMKSG